MNNKSLAFSVAAIAAASASAALMDEPAGIKIGQRMVLKPYVSASYTYDSNIDSSKHSKAGSQWTVNPGFGLDYLSDNWKINAGVWYKYHAYNRYVHQLNQSSYGEKLSLDWKNSALDEPGWRLLFDERFEQIAQDDDMSNHNGRGTGRDRKQFTAGGALERRLNKYVHLALTSDYYFLDYDNDVEKYAPMYGWKRASLGGEAGYMASRYLDLLIASNYQWYQQDNDRIVRTDEDPRGKKIKDESKGWSVMAGVGTRATEKLKYKVLTGWSHFDYAGGAKKSDGWTYQLAGDWQADAENTLHVSALGSSYYQPSEQYYGSSMKVYNLSLGVKKSLARRKLSVGFDIAYRKQESEYSEYKSNGYDEDIITTRLSLVYNINRIVSLYGTLEYQTCMTSRGAPDDHSYDYDRFRGTVGVRLTY